MLLPEEVTFKKSGVMSLKPLYLTIFQLPICDKAMTITNLS